MSENAPHANPYPGLRAFEAADSALFFGREQEADELRRRLRTTRLLAVVGGSGSGKSSLVRSGLIPSLHGGFMPGAGSSWRVAITRPGEDPIANLAVALDHPAILGDAIDSERAGTRRTLLEVTLRDSSLGLAEAVRHARLPAGDNVLVVVDQFEELFRFRRSRRAQATNDAAAFVKLLLEAQQCTDLPIFIVITMRSEFLGECMAFAGLPEAINVGQYLIPGMTRDALRAAITGPAAVGGSSVAPRLLARLLNEVGTDRDGLPVLQHALMRTWENWSRDHAPGEPLDMRHYEAIGAMRTALSVHADEAWAELSSVEQPVAERLFKSISETTDEGQLVRRERSFGALLAISGTTPERLSRVIERFRAPGRAFLQPAVGVPLHDDTIIDISHESLLRLWTRMTAWQEAEARSLEIYRRLSRSAAQYEAGEASLWRPPELTIGMDWQRDDAPTAAWAGDAVSFGKATTFLAQSRIAHRRRTVGMAAAALLVVASAVGGFAWDAHRERLVSRALRSRIDSLSRGVTVAVVDSAAGATQLPALRARYAALSSDVAAQQRKRASLDSSVTLLEQQNAILDVRVATIEAANAQLGDRAASLAYATLELATSRQRVRSTEELLTPISLSISKQRDAQGRRVDVVMSRLRRRLGLIVAGDSCADNPEPMMRLALAPAAFSPPSPRPKPEVPAAPVPQADSSSLADMSRRIAELEQRLSKLRADRALSRDEQAFLVSGNALLTEQVALLASELTRLEQTRTPLRRRNAALQTRSRNADTLHKARLALVARREEEAQREMSSLRAKSSDVFDAASKTVDVVSTMNQIETQLNAFEVTSAGYEQQLMARVLRLIAGAGRQGQSSEVSSLLTLNASRWFPYDRDDPAHPAVYNALLSALRRLDEAQARTLLTREVPGQKIGVVPATVLIDALCRRDSRPLTSSEWSEYGTPGSCYAAISARTCGDG